MPCRSQKRKCMKKKINSSSIIGTDHLIQMNTNACDRDEKSMISRLESIGNLIVDELTGSERARLKQKLLISCALNTNAIHNLPFSTSKTSLKQVLANLHTSDDPNQRQYSTIDTGERHMNTCNSLTTNDNPLNVATIKQINNGNMLTDESPLSTAIKSKNRQTRSAIIENKKKSIPNIVTRTICTRSSKLNNLNNNQEQSNYVLSNCTRKRRSSLINHTTTTVQVNQIDQDKEEVNSNVQNSIGHNVSGVKVSRKKLQSSVPSSIEC